MKEESFHIRIKELREKIGVNQIDFADQIGVNRNQFSKYERGVNTPSVDVLSKIAQIFPVVNLNWLLTGKGEMLTSGNDTLLVSEKSDEYGNKHVKELFLEKDRTIKLLTDLVEDLREDKKRLNDTIDRLQNEVEGLKNEMSKLEKGKTPA